MHCGICEMCLLRRSLVDSQNIRVPVVKITESFHDANIIVNDVVGDCRYDKQPLCHQWRQSWHHSNTQISVQLDIKLSFNQCHSNPLSDYRDTTLLWTSYAHTGNCYAENIIV